MSTLHPRDEGRRSAVNVSALPGPGLAVWLLTLGFGARRPRGRAAEDWRCSRRSDASTPGSATTARRGSTANCRREHHVGRHRVARLMRVNGIQAARCGIKSARAAPAWPSPEIADLVQRDFHADRSERGLVHRRHPDPHRRGLAVGRGDPRRLQPGSDRWATANQETPKTAISPRRRHQVRRPPAGLHHPLRPRLPVHRRRLARPGHRLRARVSIGERKSCYDNAVIESWFASFKNEEIYPKGNALHPSRGRARLFGYIWDYNTQRPALLAGLCRRHASRSRIKHLSVKPGQAQSPHILPGPRRPTTEGLQAALFLPPPPRQRPRLAHPPPPQRHDQLHPTPVTRSGIATGAVGALGTAHVDHR